MKLSAKTSPLSQMYDNLLLYVQPIFLIFQVNTTEASEFLESYKEMSSDVASHVHQFSLKEYTPTNQTPLKKSNIHIPELRQVRTDKEILQGYHNGDTYPQDIHPLDSAKLQAKEIIAARDEQIALASQPSKENVVQTQRPIGSYTPKRNASVRQKKIKDITNL